MNKYVKGVLWTLGILAAIAGIARALFLKAWTVPEEPYMAASIAPTMSPGDTILMLTRGEPRFGELVRCSDPIEGKRFVVGRIVGMPGDEVVVQGTSFLVNGKRYDRSAACDQAKTIIRHPSSQGEVELECGIVNLAGGWHFIGASRHSDPRGNVTARVAPGHFFLLSDDRSVHDDSRDYGQVPVELCRDRPIFRLWSKAGWSDVASRLTLLR